MYSIFFVTLLFRTHTIMTDSSHVLWQVSYRSRQLFFGLQCILNASRRSDYFFWLEVFPLHELCRVPVQEALLSVVFVEDLSFLRDIIEQFLRQSQILFSLAVIRPCCAARLRSLCDGTSSSYLLFYFNLAG